MKLQREIQINNLEELCMLMCDNHLPEKTYTHCIRCGKPLLSAESRTRGYGKICERKARYEDSLKLF